MNQSDQPIRDEPFVRVELFAREDRTWFWRVSVYASQKKRLGDHWCDQISHLDVPGYHDNVPKSIAIAAGALGEHQAEIMGSTFDPSEISKLAVSVYQELVDELEKSHGAAVPRPGLRGGG